MLARRLALLLVLAPAALAATPGSAMAGTLIRVIDSSSFGPVLHDGRGQAIYAFTYDRVRRSRCYGQCARDWPPVKTVGRPRAGRRVDGDLLAAERAHADRPGQRLARRAAERLLRALPCSPSAPRYSPTFSATCVA